MIRIKKIAERKVELSWETGDDYLVLRKMESLIDYRNRDKELIIGLKEELM